MSDQTGTPEPVPQGSSSSETVGLSTGSVSGELLTPSLDTTCGRATGEWETPNEFSRASGVREPTIAESRVRYQCRTILDACLEDLERARDDADDPVRRSNALAAVKAGLNDLWTVRDKRERPYAEIVNSLQTIFAARGIDEFSDGQLDAVEDALERLRDELVIDDEVAKSIATELLRGGLDVFRALY